MDSNTESSKSSFLLKSSYLSSSSSLFNNSNSSESDSPKQNLQNLKYNQKRLSLKTQEKQIEVNHSNNNNSLAIIPVPKLSHTTASDIVPASGVDVFEENSLTEEPMLSITSKEESNTNELTTTANSCRRPHSDSNSAVAIVCANKKPKLDKTDENNKTEQVEFLNNVQLQYFDKEHHDKESSPLNFESNNSTNNNFNLVLNPKNRFKSVKVLKDIEFMMNEMIKDNPDLALIDKKMDATFRYRKTEIDTFGITISNCLKIFPALKNSKILKSEFDRVQRKNINFRLLEMKLKTVLEQTYLKFRGEGFDCSSILPKINEVDLQNNNKDLLLDVMTFAFLFMESNKTNLDGKLFKIREVHEQPFFHQFGTPTIDLKGHLLSDVKISIFCEGSKFLETSTFYEAVLCAYAIHWLFNLQYEKSCAPVFDKLDSLWN